MTKDTNPYKILFKLPTRGRPEQATRTIHNIADLVAQPDLCAIYITVDNDDATSNHLIEPSGKVRCPQIWGDSKSKVDAVNRDMEKIHFGDIIVAMSDDMEWQAQGFDNIIREKMQEHFPDLDGFLHFNDGYVGDRLCTMNIMGRKYYERFNYIYHPDYVGLWCDNESTEVAKLLDRYVYDPRVIFKHQHPANTEAAQMDDSYRKYLKFNDQDNLTYRRRKYELNFDL